MKRLQDKCKEKQKVDFVYLPSGSDFLLQHKKRKCVVVGSLEKSFNPIECDIADKEAGRMFYCQCTTFQFCKVSVV